MVSSKREELAWAAGFIDGEGHFKCSKDHATSKSCYLSLEVCQVDTRALERLQNAFNGLGKIYGPYLHRGNRQPHCRFITKGFEQAQAVIAALWHWLGPVKKEQAKNALIAATQSSLRKRVTA